MALALLTPVMSGATGVNSSTKPVIDLAGVLTDREEARIANTAAGSQAIAGQCVLVQTVKSTFNDGIEAYAKRLATRLNSAGQCRDKHLVVALAIEDKQIRIEFGKQTQLTDAKVKSAIDGLMTPEFARGNFEKGLQVGLKDLLSASEAAQTRKAAAQDGWYLSSPTGVVLLNGESDFECVPAETTPLKVINDLNQSGIRFTKKDTFDESNQKVIMTIINVIELDKTLVFWRTKSGCERVAKARRDASEGLRKKYE